jgi:hypothetical protein
MSDGSAHTVKLGCDALQLPRYLSRNHESPCGKHPLRRITLVRVGNRPYKDRFDAIQNAISLIKVC